MKIVQSVQSLFNSKKEFYGILQKRVSETLVLRKKKTWHFVDRLKTIESFALKLETGRFDKYSIFHDFYACTLVVENLDEIDNSEKLIEGLFEIVEKKPNSKSYTFKSTDSFPFDDLRLYCRLGDKYIGSINPDIKTFIFEVQIKTFLQHAWSIATHDIIYKTDRIAWGKERVAFQVKAALEQAEVAISGANNLSKVNELAKENKIVKKTNRVIILLSQLFQKDDLPNDKRRLAQNVISLIETLDISPKDLEGILKKETASGRGTLTKNLSPFQVIIKSIYMQEQSKVTSYLRKRKTRGYKLLISPEMGINELRNVVKANKISLEI